MSVESFKLAETDLTANQRETIVLDQNGDKCALIKIETTLHSFSFDTGSLGISKVLYQNDEHPGEIWLYVPHGVKKITIQHPQLGTIRDYDLGLSVKKGKTYILKLTTDQVNTTVVDYNNRQYLVLNVYPSNASVYINGVLFKLNEHGTLEELLTFGTHNYRISAPDYHTLEGQILINDKDNKQKLDITLKQAFGYVSIKAPSSEFNDADIYIDEVKVGKIPLANFPLKSGMHKVSISKRLYHSFFQDFAITDSSFVNITPTFEPNYAEITILPNDDDADILLLDNNEILGNGKWQGRIEAGEHQITAQKAGHRTTYKKVTVIAGQKTIVKLDNPTPIYGSLEIKTTPSDADIYIDNKKIGTSPYIQNNILVGERQIEIKKKGYKIEKCIVKIEEGKTHSIEKSLTDYCNAIIDANTTAKVYIDKVYVGNTPYTCNTIAGKYLVELSANKYSTYSKHMNLNGSTQNMDIRLKRNFVTQNEFYFTFGANPIGLKTWNIGVGFYLFNFNLETNYMGRMASSENIYLTDGETVPFIASYSPHAGNIKLGYGIRCNSRFRVTPQIGLQGMSMKEKIHDDNSFDYAYFTYADGAYALSMTLGARLSFALTSWLGISVGPEYMIPFLKSEGYEILSNISKDIKGYSSGLNCNFNMNIYF